jgi:7,8-dihydropterin-6-yl-methyl-4-(beta-D-ribofuranosyl)aminobenzene 5'-phosphate synthase
MTDNAPISIVMGGIHLIDANEDRIHKTIHLLSEFSVGKLALCHCTGMKALVEAYNAFGNKLLINNVGTRIEF